MELSVVVDGLKLIEIEKNDRNDISILKAELYAKLIDLGWKDPNNQNKKEWDSKIGGVSFSYPSFCKVCL